MNDFAMKETWSRMNKARGARRQEKRARKVYRHNLWLRQGQKQRTQPFLYLVQKDEAYIGGYTIATSEYRNICCCQAIEPLPATQMQRNKSDRRKRP